MLLQFLAALSMLGVLPIAAGSQCSASSHSDGCTTLVHFDHFKEEFKPACDKHDICNSCAQRFGLTRQDCDDKFTDDMKELCDKSTEAERCHTVRELYIHMIHRYGEKRYVEVSPAWCRESWVNQCIV